MQYIYRVSILIVLVIMSSCGGSDDSPAPIPDPVASILIFPEKDKECFISTVLSDTESEVTFEWNASINTDSYTLSLRDLSANSTSQHNSATNSVKITINRGVAYEWFVTSKATGTSSTAKSEEWRFFNEGIGVLSHAPFPADIVFPKSSNTLDNAGDVVLEWTAVDIDNDIKEYEVFFGATNPPASVGTVTTTSKTVTTVAATTYYWSILTKDTEGNTSESEVFQFKVK